MSDHVFDLEEEGGFQSIWAYPSADKPGCLHLVMLDEYDPVMNLTEAQVAELIVALQEWLAKHEGMG